MNHVCYDAYEVDPRCLEAGATVQFGGVVFLDAVDLVPGLFVGCWPLHARNTMNGRAARMNRVWALLGMCTLGAFLSCYLVAAVWLSSVGRRVGGTISAPASVRWMALVRRMAFFP